MFYAVVIYANSPLGERLLSGQQNTFSHRMLYNDVHPVIFCSKIDLGIGSSFAQLEQLADQREPFFGQQENPKVRTLLIPCMHIALAIEGGGDERYPAGFLGAT